MAGNRAGCAGGDAGASWSGGRSATLVATGFGSGGPAATGGIGADLALSAVVAASVCCRGVTGASRAGVLSRMGTATGGGCTVVGADARSTGVSIGATRLTALRRACGVSLGLLPVSVSLTACVAASGGGSAHAAGGSCDGCDAAAGGASGGAVHATLAPAMVGTEHLTAHPAHPALRSPRRSIDQRVPQPRRASPVHWRIP